jgi:hypothetical protein
MHISSLICHIILKDAAAAVGILRSLNIKVVMLTGDNLYVSTIYSLNICIDGDLARCIVARHEPSASKQVLVMFSPKFYRLRRPITSSSCKRLGRLWPWLAMASTTRLLWRKLILELLLAPRPMLHWKRHQLS